MAGERQRQKLEAAGHVTTAVREQRDKWFLLLIQCGTQEMVPPTSRVGLPC